MFRTDPKPGRWSRERGAGRLKAIIWTAILVAGAFVAWKEVPPRFDEYQLHDKLREEAIFASSSRKTADDVRKEVLEKIQDLGIPATKDNIKVELDLHGCRITVEYTVPVDLIVFQHELHFNPVGDNRSL
jgi:hypothetical protein